MLAPWGQTPNGVSEQETSPPSLLSDGLKGALQPLHSQAHRQVAEVGSGAGATDIGILLAAYLNNLMAISRAAMVVGAGAWGKIYRENHSRLGFCLPLFSWHLSCMF